MDIFKKTNDEKEYEKEKYTFIKEQVRPQRKRQVCCFVKKSCAVLSLGILFGAVAAVSFFFISNKLDERYFSEASQIKPTTTIKETPAATSGAVSQNKTATSYDIKKEELARIDEYGKISKKLAAVGERFNNAIVNIKRKNKMSEWSATSEDNLQQIVGVIYRETGSYYYIVSLESTFSDSETIVEFYDGEAVAAELLASDSNTGIAVFRVSKDEIKPSTRASLLVPEVGSVANVMTGTNIIAVGAPNGMLNSVMLGRVIKDNIDAAVTDGEVTLFATDIMYSEHASGVILNTKGRMVGIINNSFKSTLGTSGNTFIGITDLTDNIELMMKGKSAAYLGIMGCDIDAKDAERHDIETGVYLDDVYSNSPAYEGGMRVADVITHVNGRRISSLYGLQGILLSSEPKEKVTFTIARKVNKRTIHKNITVKLG